MEAPAVITRHRRPFLLPIWLTFAAFLAAFVLAVLGYLVYRSAATTTVVVLVRHAEKDLSSIQDPPLSAEGEERAQRLARMFGHSSGAGHVDAIYVTDSRSTEQTAAPLAERLGRQPIVVPAGEVRALASRVLREHPGGSALVIGQRATVPELVHELSDLEVPAISDDEYDTLYVLSIPAFGRASVLRMEY